MTGRLVALAALAIGLGGVAWFAFPRDSWPRGHARWIVRATIGFAVPALAGLALLGRIDALWMLPPEFAPVARLLPRFDPMALVPAFAVAVPLGALFVWARIWWLRRRGRPLPNSIVAPAPLAARRPADIAPAVATALVAGWTEELAFRLALPLTAAIATGSVWLGFALATAAFVALHRYQRWPGRIGVLLSGLALIALYLSTGALWLVIALHATIDVMALAVRPWLAGFRR